MESELARVGADAPILLLCCTRSVNRAAARIADDLGLEAIVFATESAQSVGVSVSAVRIATMFAPLPDLMLAYWSDRAGNGLVNAIAREAAMRHVPTRLVRSRLLAHSP